MRSPRLLLASLLTAAVVSALHSQDHAHGPASAGRLGRVDFPSGCSPAVQPRFERAVALLHSFWYEEAGHAFAEVVRADSACALGYWGTAISRLHPLWTPPSAAENAEALAAARRAVRLSRPGTRERAWAETATAYYGDYDSIDHPTRLRAYETALRHLAERYPADDEARIFLALALIANGQLAATDTTYARQREAGRILEPLFRRHPDHPGLAHYLIHAYDSPALADEGIGAANRYAAIAPSVPHAQHMPSHIYVRVGRWADVIAANRRSAAAGRRFEVEQKMGGLWDQRAHALDYLVYGYLQLGQVQQAQAIADELAGTRVTVPAGSLTSDYALAAIPARLALERNRWSAAAALPVRPAPEWRAAEGITRFARALGLARSGRPDAARAELDSLAALEQALREAGGLQTYWAGQVRIQRLAAGAWVEWAGGDTAQALHDASAAADLEDGTEKHPVTPGPVLPARELFADLLTAAGRRAEARDQYQAVLRRQPQRARSLAALRHLGVVSRASR
jgi:hypothetical protein